VCGGELIIMRKREERKRDGYILLIIHRAVITFIVVQ